jgi:hypothetical protein
MVIIRSLLMAKVAAATAAKDAGDRGMGRSEANLTYYSPHSKEPNPQQAEQGHEKIRQCV